METESAANQVWETASALICVVALVLIVAIVQLWPQSPAAPVPQPNLDVTQLSEDWSRAPVLQRITQSKSFQQAKKEHQALIVRGWLDKSSPKRFQALSSKSKDVAVHMTICRIAERSKARLQATTFPQR